MAQAVIIPDYYGDRYCVQRWAHREEPGAKFFEGVMWCPLCFDDSYPSEAPVVVVEEYQPQPAPEPAPVIPVPEPPAPELDPVTTEEPNPEVPPTDPLVEPVP